MMPPGSYSILLINPDFNEPYRSFPIGLASLTGRLVEAGFKVSVVDLDSRGYTPEQAAQLVAKAISENDPILVGLSGMITNLKSVRQTLSGIRAIAPGLPIVLGGSLAMTAPKQVLCSLDADYLVLGDGELPLLMLAKLLSETGDLDTIPNLAYRSDKGWQTSKAKEWRCPVMGEPMIRYDLFDVRSYIQPPAVNYFDIVSGRGCVMNCNFCFRMSGKTIRKKSVSDMIDEIELLSTKYGLSKFNFADDNFGLKPAWIDEMMVERRRRNLDFEWRFQASVNTFRSRDAIAKMAQNGLRGCSIGIETGAPDIFKRIGKGKDLSQVTQLLSWLNDEHVSVNATFILGWPEETPDTIEQTRNFLRANRFSRNFQLFLLTPYPGTELYRDALESGRIVDEESYVSNLNGQRELQVNLSSMSNSELLAAHRDIIAEFHGEEKSDSHG